MKYQLTLALAAILTSTAFAALPAPLPEFKNEKQLAEWRAEKAAESAVPTAAADTAFYTGKPYVESSGGYAFKYRSYNPELARWTSEDPSGFPDGANASIYAPRPTSGLDPLGLANVSVTGTPNAYTEGANFSIDVIQKAQQVGGSIRAQMQVGWAVTTGLSGYVVQHLNFNQQVLNSDGSIVPLGMSTSSYWEAFRVDNGSAIGGDMFDTQAFDSNTHGSFSVTGTVDFYRDSVFTSTNSPSGWGANVPEAGGLPSTTSLPSWWTGSGFNHNLTMTWTE